MTQLSRYVTQVKAVDMGKMPQRFSGITNTPGRSKPYAVWREGYIWIYTSTEMEAHNGYVNAMRNLQGVN